MKENYLVYPCKTMRITQSYKGSTSHKPHTTGTPKDYPIDEGCSDTGRDWMFCPCDEMKVRRVYGVGSKGTNTLWLESTEKARLADGTKGYVTLLITHPDDSDLKSLKVGKRFKRGEKICREGSDGATGNHFHFSVGKGKFADTGWKRNSAGKWVLTVTGKTLPPEKLFYVDRNFTRVISTKGLEFITLPKEEKTYLPGNYKVTKANLLYVRKSPTTKSEKKNYSELTPSAKSKIAALCGEERNGYVKGLTFTVTQVKKNWGKTPSGWVCLDYCEEI